MLLYALLIFRVLNALSLRTFFQPDEYFQSLEPAWQAAFGVDSGAWITWEWREHLRSSIHPLLFAAVYWTVDVCAKVVASSPHHRAELLVIAPSLLQACFAAVMDLSTWSLAGRVYGRNSPAAWAALALTVCSPWQYFCSTRTLSNSLETALTVFALDLWPWQMLLDAPPLANARSGRPSLPLPARSLALSLGAAAVACILRPTNIIIWLTIGSLTVLSQRDTAAKLFLVQSAALSGTAALAASAVLDRMYYGQWALPPLQFLRFNILQSLSVFYGQNRPDYYLTEGLPLLLTTALPFAALGLWRALKPQEAAAPGPGKAAAAGAAQRSKRALALAVLSTLSVLTLVSHKEVRFIYPLLPILHILAAQPLASIFAPFPHPRAASRKAGLALILAANLSIACYVSSAHKRGALDVVHYLRHAHEARVVGAGAGAGAGAGTHSSVGFLMPCHSTPWRSQLVYAEIGAWALGCEPPLGVAAGSRGAYRDEAENFYADPARWLDAHMDDVAGMARDGQAAASGGAGVARGGPRRPWPQYLAFFAPLEPVLQDVLGNTSYGECWRGFNTHWHDDARRAGDVIVWCDAASL